MKNFRLYIGEIFKEITLEHSISKKYAISNRGRLISYDDVMENGKLLKGAISEGYKILLYNYVENGVRKTKRLFTYKLVAQLFLPKTLPEQIYVIHLDWSRDNDDVRNLQWVTYQEKLLHATKSPRVIACRLQNKVKPNFTSKLTTTEVMRIKKMLAKPHSKTRQKMIAKQFGVSEMQISRIKSGENWSHITI